MEPMSVVFRGDDPPYPPVPVLSRPDRKKRDRIRPAKHGRKPRTILVPWLAALAVVIGLSACAAGGSSPVTASSSGAAAAPSTAAASGGTSAAPGSAAPAGSAAIVPEASTLQWKACGGQLAGLPSASLPAPLTYADPGGRKITIALSRAPATAPPAQQQGVMLVNPGGPGAPGRSLAGDGAAGGRPPAAAPDAHLRLHPR